MIQLALQEAPTPRAGSLGSADLGHVRPIPRISIQAFCEGADFAAIVEKAATDRRMSRAHVKVQMGGLAAAAEFYHAAPTPNLILAETHLAGERLIAELDHLAEVCDAGTKIVIVGRANDVELYRLLIRRGVSEYLVGPVSAPDIIKSIADLYLDTGKAPLGRSIAFVGAKGGAGSSMVAHNVAWSIARNLQNEVVIADLDVAFGTAGLDFNQDPAQGISDAIHSPERLDDTFLDRLLARCSDHLSLLAAPATLDRTCDYDETTFEAMIEVAQNGVPAVILDIPHVWTAWARRVLIAADEIVLTAEPDLANLRNAKNLLDMLRTLRQGDAPPRLVINKQGMAKRPEIKVADFTAALAIEPIAVIGFEPQLFGTAANNGQMIAETDPKSAAAAAFDHIAQILTGRVDVKPKRTSALAPLLARLRSRKSGAA
ncbi:CtpF protein [Kaistia algarum]|uniref:AAA family ATPase n=1 Tax=Kaistia algarum TaxID=2083279 RepID=UPI000CE8D79E|nr:AAA family ATPase [Kaistia algarum]MCX5516649.1 AAA family ATPase [Kaistia algarum]PPE77262.1 CtpF protein [Kaistia algarum]